jgi:formylglycine-generating enzyme required for sulfatase activity
MRRILVFVAFSVVFFALSAVAQEKAAARKVVCPKCGHKWEVVDPAPPGMVAIPAGTYRMGCNEASDKECQSVEKPAHDVYLDAFYIDKSEATVADYGKCVQAGVCTPPKTQEKSKYCNFGQQGRDNHPINCVEWLQAKTYCEWAGKRLPTEAEWERAARGAESRVNPWGPGKATCDFAVLNIGGEGCGAGGTWPVCSKLKGNTPDGLCDMIGNVWEWVSDWYEADFYKTSPTVNPPGPVKSPNNERVLRGASFTSELAESSRASNRFWFKSDVGLGNFGFRCVKPAR